MDLFADKHKSVRIIDNRVVKKSVDKEALAFEADVERELSHFNFCPKILTFDGESLVEEFITGVPFSRTDKITRQQLITKIAVILKNLHSHELSRKLYTVLQRDLNKDGQYSGEKVFELMIRETKIGDKLLMDLRNIISEGDRILAKSDYKLSLIHGDLNPDNILVDKTNVKIIDWAEVRYDLPSLDIAQFFVSNNLNSEEEALFFSYYKPSYLTDVILDSHKSLIYTYEYIKNGRCRNEIEALIAKYRQLF